MAAGLKRQSTLIDSGLVSPAPKRRQPPAGSSAAFKVIAYNCNGLRAAMKPRPGGPWPSIVEFVAEEKPDVLFLGETKIGASLIDSFVRTSCPYGPDAAKSPFRGYSGFFHCSTARQGYAGTAAFIREGVHCAEVSFGIPDTAYTDDEGRVLTLDLGERGFLVHAYVPNVGRDLDRLSLRTRVWEPAMRQHLAKLRETGRPVCYLGDLNCCHELALDIYSEKGKAKSPGCTADERAAFDAMVQDDAMVDLWRRRNPALKSYTYWSNTAKSRKVGDATSGNGWRLDYVLCSKEALPIVGEIKPLPTANHSDHCPISFCYKSK
jgi:exodeoxyribonuclease III